MAMEGIPDINRAEPKEVMSAGAPPPPTEVKVRTMKSDIAAMAQSGGGLPHFQNIKVSGLSLEIEEQAPSAVHKKNALVAIVITLVALVVLGVLAYFAYMLLSAPK